MLRDHQLAAVLAGALLAGAPAVSCHSPSEPDAGPELVVVGPAAELPADQELADQLWAEDLRCTDLMGKVHLNGVKVHLVTGYPMPPCVVINGLFPEGCQTYNPLGVWANRSSSLGLERILRHEFIHLIMAKRGYMADYGHVNPWWAKCSRPLS